MRISVAGVARVWPDAARLRRRRDDGAPDGPVTRAARRPSPAATDGDRAHGPRGRPGALGSRYQRRPRRHGHDGRSSHGGPVPHRGAGGRLLASRLRVPALLVLLLVGFAAGALTDDVDPREAAWRRLLAAGLPRGGGDPLRGRARPGDRAAAVPYASHRGLAGLAGGADHLAVHRAVRRAGAGHVQGRGGDAVRDPRRVRADGRGAVAQFRAALRTAATRPGPGGHPARPRSPRHRRRRASTAPGGSCPRPPW